jgi:hypothetical protein
VEIELNRTSEGVCPIVFVILGRRGVGKTLLMEATAPWFAPPEKLVIVSPIQTLKARMPSVPWYKVSVNDKEGMEKLFRGFLNDGVQRFVLADEADELTAANAAGTAGGFVAQGVYDYINYGREQGLGISLSSRRPSNIAKDITANANLVAVAQTVDPAALDYYQAWMHDPTRPEIDWRAKCQVLPTHERYPWTVFMLWEPGKKFLGYVTVDPASKQVRPWDPSELEGMDQLETAPAASDTEPSTTTDTNASVPAEAPPESTAGSVTKPSGTVRAASTATSTESSS